MSKKKVLRFVKVEPRKESAHVRNTRALAKAAPIDTTKARVPDEVLRKERT